MIHGEDAHGQSHLFKIAFQVTKQYSDLKSTYSKENFIAAKLG